MSPANPCPSVVDQSPHNQQRYRNTSNRDGTVLVVVLVCLIVVATVLIGTVGVSIRYRQQIRTELQMEQTYWLLDAGIGTAIANFNQDPESENMDVVIDHVMENHIGSVSITQLKRTDQQLTLRVTAKIRGNHQLGKTTQRSRMIVLEKN